MKEVISVMETVGSRTEAKLQEGKLSKPTKVRAKAGQVHPPHKNTKRNFALDKVKFKPPPPMITPVEKRNASKFLISFLPLEEEDRMEGPMIIEAEMGRHCVHRMYMDGGSSSEILYKHCFNRFYSEVRNQMVPATTPLVGFSGEIIWPLWQISLLARSKENPSSSVYTSRNAKIPSDRRNSHIAEQHDYSTRMHNGFRTRGVTALDFIVERLEDDPTDTPMVEKEELSDPWILFTDGSSCIDEEILQEEKKKARAIRRKAGRYVFEFCIKDTKNLIRRCNSCQAHRTMIKSSNGEMPLWLTYGTKAMILVEIGMPTLRTAEVDMIKNDEALEINLDLLEKKREHAAIPEAKSKAMMEKYYNARVCNISFKPADLVYQSNEASHAKDKGKLGHKWEGLNEVMEALGKGAYKLKDRDGSILHVSDLVPLLTKEHISNTLGYESLISAEHKSCLLNDTIFQNHKK
uniref:Reverse transcriptase domain-containing protein n=1 Tax=Tanacetum cinerariifolium TaxID=118510 RepID=A0A699H073_TANCI|nr:reverse transcriptase domain-containing protein [Tanacetum cinerariifolium]